MTEDRLGEPAQFLQARGIDVAMQAVAVGIHGADGGKAIDPQLPHRLGNAELLEPVHPIDLGHAVGVELGRPSDGVEIDRPVLLQPPQGFGPIPPLPMTARIPNFPMMSAW